MDYDDKENGNMDAQELIIMPSIYLANYLNEFEDVILRYRVQNFQ